VVEGYLSNTGPASRIFVVISALLPLESATATILVLNNTRAHTAGLQAGCCGGRVEPAEAAGAGSRDCTLLRKRAMSAEEEASLSLGAGVRWLREGKGKRVWAADLGGGLGDEHDQQL
jgi:hypothetical protein